MGLIAQISTRTVLMAPRLLIYGIPGIRPLVGRVYDEVTKKLEAPAHAA